MADLLVCAFTWEDTKEGEGYWFALYKRLCQIAENGEL